MDFAYFHFLKCELPIGFRQWVVHNQGNEPFTEDDVIPALEAFNDSYVRYPIDTIEKRQDSGLNATNATIEINLNISK